jgi:aspartate/methionine/tyrosine aminotransferase
MSLLVADLSPPRKGKTDPIGLGQKKISRSALVLAAMFSARTSWDRTANPLAIAVEQARAAGRSLIDLTESNPTRADIFGTEPLIAELGNPRGAVYEPAPFGHDQARNAVAAYYATRGLRVNPAHVVLSASTSEAYSWILSLLSDVGDTVLVPRPSYPLLGWIAANQGVRLVTYSLSREAGFRVDLLELAGAIDERTRGIVLVHPNNPTGHFVRRDDARALAVLAKRHGIALIVDEVFGDYALGGLPSDALPSFLDLPATETPLMFVLSGLSKVLLLPQCKLGWTVVTGEPPRVEEALARLELIADTFLSVGTPIQLALPALLGAQPRVRRAVLERVGQNLATLDRAIDALGPEAPLRRLPAEGGWYAVLEVPRVRDEDAWTELLVREEGVIVHPGYFFDFDRDGFVVVSLILPTTLFAEGVGRLVRRLGDAR